ncbi:MAG: transglycosylase SLT domain-containing protein [Clostridiales bacterium]|nr:transglycosylase SLT domain-containing protein [Clostridiales bacterium]
MMAKLIAALIVVESGGDPAAVGDSGRALGCLQIHPDVVQDVNRIYGTQYHHAAAMTPRHAKRIAELYLLAVAGCGASAERMARVWNGGPRGHRKPETVSYWLKVQAVMRHE